MLKVNGVGYTLPDGRVLFSDVELGLVPGDAIAIEGPSGTGKSTLLAVLGGLLEPRDGRVLNESTREAPFAWVLQSLNGLTARSVLANACLLGVLDGESLGEVRKRAMSLLTELGLDRHCDKRAKQLSGGELQRLAVARALASTRPVILADEPTNQLDRDNARRVMRLLFESAAVDQRIVIVVTHD
jgi:ABC-type lipoprotein export system ATPase subunit